VRHDFHIGQLLCLGGKLSVSSIKEDVGIPLAAAGEYVQIVFLTCPVKRGYCGELQREVDCTVLIQAFCTCTEHKSHYSTVLVYRVQDDSG
jgi:hypothetical protein